MQLDYVLPLDRMERARTIFTNTRPVLRTVNFHGLPISIEIDKGDTKSGTDANGEKWSKTYYVPYGEIPSTRSLADGDGVDIYLAGLNPNALVYIVHQRKYTGEYDESKVILGASSAAEAEKIYRDHGPSWGWMGMETMSWDNFERGYLAANRKV